MPSSRAIALILCAVFCFRDALAEDATLELGAVAERATAATVVHAGPSVAIEVTPIEHWLELEFGVDAVRSEGATEWDTGLLFKKPFDLSRTTEMMIGLGPTWIHVTAVSERANSLGGEFALDFMFWTHRPWGWYLEPSYSFSFDRGGERTIGITAGVLIGIL